MTDNTDQASILTDEERRQALVRIVDDDPALLKSTAFLLRMAGFDVLVYDRAQTFLEMNDDSRPGCILLDQRMPGMTGLECQEALLARSCIAPVIFLSAHGDIPMAMQAVHRGALDFLVKPADPQVLVAAVEKAAVESFRRLAEQQSQEADMRASIDSAKAVDSLTSRELEVVQLVAKDMLNKQIADALSISLPTVKMHRGSATKKLGVRSAVGIAQVLQTAGRMGDDHAAR